MCPYSLPPLITRYEQRRSSISESICEQISEDEFMSRNTILSNGVPQDHPLNDSGQAYKEDDTRSPWDENPRAFFHCLYTTSEEIICTL